MPHSADVGNTTAPAGEEMNMSDHGMPEEYDVSKIDLSGQPAYICPGLEVLHYDGAGTFGLETLGRRLQKELDARVPFVFRLST